MKYAYGYQRVSTVKQEESELGLTSQKTTIEKEYHANWKEKGYQWAGHYVDPAVSGTIQFLEREAGGELSRRVQRGDVILIHRIDRGFCAMMDMLKTLEVFEQRGVGVRFIKEGLSTGDGPMGALILQILTAFSQFERELIRSRTRESMAMLIAKGQPTNGTHPIGFIWIGKKGQKRVKRDDHDRKVMANIVTWRKMGITWDGITGHIEKYGVKTSKGGSWNVTRVRRAYCAELYLQAVEEGGRKVEEDPAELLAYRDFCRRYMGKIPMVRDVEEKLSVVGKVG